MVPVEIFGRAIRGVGFVLWLLSCGAQLSIDSMPGYWLAAQQVDPSKLSDSIKLASEQAMITAQISKFRTAEVLGTMSLTSVTQAASSTDKKPGVWQLFVDPNSHDVLVEYDHDEHEWTDMLAWVHRNEVRPLDAYSKIRGVGFLLTVDLRTRRLYGASPTLHGSGGYLHVYSFGGQEIGSSQDQEMGSLHYLVLGSRRNTSYREYTGWGHDIDDGWVGYYRGEKEIRHLPISEYPIQLVYAPAVNRLLIHYVGKVQTLDGTGYYLPNGRQYRQLYPYASVQPSDFPSMMAVSRAGTRLYYADPIGRAVYKLRLSDGKVLASRRLTFAPVAMALDENAKSLCFVDGVHQSLIRVRTF